MSVIQMWFLGAILVGFWFSFAADLEQGDYPRATSILLFAALWPVAAAMGAGISVGQLWRFVRRLARSRA